jgi:NAD(P)-dependent dehydrogenase (short-subunit alcohol dehydrogenase family)
MTDERVSSPGAVVVTGASSGIGQACALHLDRMGFRVFASVRSERAGEMLRQRASDRLSVVQLDITDAATIAAAADQIAAAVGAAGLAGLVNNAGISVDGPLEFLPLAGLRKQFEVNVIGQIAVTQAFLPLLRRGHGRVVLMGSIAGNMIYPFIGPYSASKAALQALAAALRVELSPWSLPVSIVIAGTIATPHWEKSAHELEGIAGTLPREAQDLYGRAIAATRAYREKTGKAGSPPEVVAAAVAHALGARRPRTRYVVGRYATLMRFVGCLPEWMLDGFMVRAMRLPQRAAEESVT